MKKITYRGKKGVFFTEEEYSEITSTFKKQDVLIRELDGMISRKED